MALPFLFHRNIKHTSVADVCFGEKRVIYLAYFNSSSASNATSPTPETPASNDPSFLSSIIAGYRNVYDETRNKNEKILSADGISSLIVTGVFGTAHAIAKTLKWGVVDTIPSAVQKLQEQQKENQKNLIDNPAQSAGVIEKARQQFTRVLSPSTIQEPDLINYDIGSSLSTKCLDRLKQQGIPSFLKTINKSWKNAGITLKLTADNDVSIEKLREIQMWVLENHKSLDIHSGTLGTKITPLKRTTGHTLHIGDPQNIAIKTTSRGFETVAVGKNPRMPFIKKTLDDLATRRNENAWRTQSLKKGKIAWEYTGGHIWQKGKDFYRGDPDYMDSQVQNPTSIVFPSYYEILRQDKNKGTESKFYDSEKINKNVSEEDFNDMDTAKYARLINNAFYAHRIDMRFDEDTLKNVSNKQLQDVYNYCKENSFLDLDKSNNHFRIVFDDNKESKIKNLLRSDLFTNIYVGNGPSFQGIINELETTIQTESFLAQKMKINQMKQEIILDEIQQNIHESSLNDSQKQSLEYVLEKRILPDEILKTLNSSIDIQKLDFNELQLIEMDHKIDELFSVSKDVDKLKKSNYSDLKNSLKEIFESGDFIDATLLEGILDKCNTVDDLKWFADEMIKTKTKHDRDSFCENINNTPFLDTNTMKKLEKIQQLRQKLQEAEKYYNQIPDGELKEIAKTEWEKIAKNYNEMIEMIKKKE